MIDTSQHDGLKRPAERNPTSLTSAPLANEYRRPGLLGLSQAVSACRQAPLTYPGSTAPNAPSERSQETIDATRAKRRA